MLWVHVHNEVTAEWLALMNVAELQKTYYADGTAVELGQPAKSRRANPRLTHRATDPSDAPQDEKAILAVSHKRRDEREDPQQEKASLEDDLGGEQVAQAACE